VDLNAKIKGSQNKGFYSILLMHKQAHTLSSITATMANHTAYKF